MNKTLKKYFLIGELLLVWALRYKKTVDTRQKMQDVS